jgi:hypothetical protein
MSLCDIPDCEGCRDRDARIVDLEHQLETQRLLVKEWKESARVMRERLAKVVAGVAEEAK